MKKALAVALFALSAMSPLAPELALAQAVAAEQTLTFTIDNMTCALCPVTVKRAMESVVGVQAVEINFDARTATVVFDASRTSPEAIATASANAGYPARITG